jgi:hypothetical protein
MAMQRLVAALAMAATVQTSAPAQARDDFCLQLNRIVDAAAQWERIRPGDSPFELLRTGHAGPPRLGFSSPCQIAGLRRQFWYCSAIDAPDSLSRQRLAERTAQCLPQARRIDGITTRFELPHATIVISESGGPGPRVGPSHVGRSVAFSVEAIEPAE